MIRTNKHFCFRRCSVKICTALRQCPFAGLPSQLSSHELYQQHRWTLILFKVISGETVRWHLRLQLLWCHVVVSFEFGSQSLALKSNFKDFKIFPVWNKIIKSLDLCPGVWEYHSVLMACHLCSVPNAQFLSENWVHTLWIQREHLSHPGLSIYRKITVYLVIKTLAVGDYSTMMEVTLIPPENLQDLKDLDLWP